MTAPREHPPAPTPTPWLWFSKINMDQTDPEKRYTQERGGEPKCRHLVGADGQGLAFTVGLSSPTDEANADLIVTAVNAHAPLVEACRALLPMLVADVERHRISALTYATSHPDTARAAAEARDARAAALEALRAALQKAGAAE